MFEQWAFQLDFIFFSAADGGPHGQELLRLLSTTTKRYPRARRQESPIPLVSLKFLKSAETL